MNILSAFIVFDVLIIVYEIIVALFSALYELSGLTKEQARFQVTSLLTGTGFTTAESEKMLETKKRKRVTRDIMIISYIFNISIISTLITLFTSTQTSSFYDLLIGLVLSALILLILLFSKKISKIRNWIDKSFLFLVGIIFYKKQNQIIIYDYYDKNVLAEVKLNKMPEFLKDKNLKELNLKNNFNIHILSIKRKNKIITNIKDKTILCRKDLILLIGNKKVINNIFQQ